MRKVRSRKSGDATLLGRQPIHQYQSWDTVEVARVVRDQRHAAAERNTGDLQVEIGEGRAGPPQVVFQFAVAAGCVCVKWQDRDDLKQLIHESKILGQTLGSVRAEDKLAYRHCGDQKRRVRSNPILPFQPAAQDGDTVIRIEDEIHRSTSRPVDARRSA